LVKDFILKETGFLFVNDIKRGINAGS